MTIQPADKAGSKSENGTWWLRREMGKLRTSGVTGRTDEHHAPSRNVEAAEKSIRTLRLPISYLKFRIGNLTKAKPKIARKPDLH